MTTPRVSVCMATYNGHEFVDEQIQSILCQLDTTDELVIVDDASKDQTTSILRDLANRDARIRLTCHTTNRGYVKTFAEAMRQACGEFILLSDQDDVWTPDHVSTLVTALERADVAATNLATLGGANTIPGPYGQKDWHLRSIRRGSYRRNILGILAGNRPYYGCAMGLRASARDAYVLPFPTFLNESHDLWIALAGNLQRSIVHCPERTVFRRFHENNQTPNRPRGLRAALSSRMLLIRCLRELNTRRSTPRL